jgi:hypothetical protein
MVLITVEMRTSVVVLSSVVTRVLAINVVIYTRIIVLAGLLTVDMRTRVTVVDRTESVTVCAAL